MTDLESIRKSIDESSVALMIGTGLSASATGNAQTSTWRGLISSGADRVVELSRTPMEDWRKTVSAQLGLDTPDSFIEAAGSVKKALQRIGTPTYNRWLEEDIGQLPITNPEAVKAATDLPYPILTTNYDTILEQVSERGTATWTDGHTFQEALARQSNSIAHIHGVWSNPESVILSETDYYRITHDESAQALLRAIAALKSIVYVGYGGGLNDPNFSELIAWQGRALPDASVTHYRLCLERDLGSLRQEHANSNIVPVSYGSTYDDLPKALQKLEPKTSAVTLNSSGLTRDVTQQAVQNLRDSMVEESVLIDLHTKGHIYSDLILPPILISTPYATHVRNQMGMREKGEDARIDGATEVSCHDLIVVVGDEGAGLTTAIKWLACEASSSAKSAAPIFVRYKDCKKGNTPLAYEVRNQATLQGITGSLKDTLPEHVLVIDDFNYDTKKRVHRIASEIASSKASTVIVGCKQGDEEVLAGALKEYKSSPRILYLGRLRNADIKTLAVQVEPQQAKQIASDVAHILDSENLQRTPLTVSLLLFMVIRGGVHDAFSQTSIIDDYVALLIRGIGSPFSNDTGLSETDLGAFLKVIAQEMVISETPSLPEHKALQVISDVIERYGWTHQTRASAVLKFLISRRALRRSDSAVEFGRYSFLTLFAARRAKIDSDFRNRIDGDLFYYAPVARRLAALSRTDVSLFKSMRPLLEAELSNPKPTGTLYEGLNLTTHTIEPEEDLIAEEEWAAEEAETPPFSSEDMELDIDRPENNSPGGFGLVVSEMSTAARMNRTVHLCSSMIRDLDQVEDLAEKRDLLELILELWGRVISAIHADPLMGTLKESIRRDLPDSSEFEDDSSHADWQDMVIRSLPAGIVYSGMEQTLKSPKLNESLLELTQRQSLQESTEATTGALFMLLLSQPNNWPSAAKRLVDRISPKNEVVFRFFRALCENEHASAAADNSALRELCELMFVKANVFATSDLKEAHLNAYRRNLSTLRSRMSSQARY